MTQPHSFEGRVGNGQGMKGKPTRFRVGLGRRDANHDSRINGWPAAQYSPNAHLL